MYVNDIERLDIADDHYFDSLTEIQGEALDYVAASGSARKVLNTSSTGTGKTRMAMEYISRFDHYLINHKPIVICPKATKEQWIKAFADAGKTAVDAIKVGMSVDMDIADALVTTPQGLGRWMHKNDEMDTKKHPNDFNERFANRFGMVLYDEVHSASRNSQAIEALKVFAPYSEAIYAMSATPEWNSPENLYELCKVIFPRVNHMPHDIFVDKFCTQEPFVREAKPYDSIRGLDVFQVNGVLMCKDMKVVGWKHPSSVDDYLSYMPCVISVRNKLLPYTHKKFVVQLPNVQRGQYDNMVDYKTMRTRTGNYVADYSIVARIRMRQVCLAEVELVDLEAVISKLVEAGKKPPKSLPEVRFAEGGSSPKADWIAKAASVSKRRVIVWTDSAQFALKLEKEIPNLRAYTGKHTARERKKVVKWFHDTPNAFMCIVCAAGGTGLDGLQKVCNTQIWANRSEPLGGAQERQCLGRLNRTGSPFDRVYNYELVAEDTLEDV